MAEANATRLGLAGDVTARHEAHAARIALMCAMVDGEENFVRPTHLRAAIAFCEYAHQSAGCIFGISTGNMPSLWRRRWRTATGL
jgi:hypothetical protein